MCVYVMVCVHVRMCVCTCVCVCVHVRGCAYCVAELRAHSFACCVAGGHCSPARLGAHFCRGKEGVGGEALGALGRFVCASNEPQMVGFVVGSVLGFVCASMNHTCPTHSAGETNPIPSAAHMRQCLPAHVCSHLQRCSCAAVPEQNHHATPSPCSSHPRTLWTALSLLGLHWPLPPFAFVARAHACLAHATSPPPLATIDSQAAPGIWLVRAPQAWTCHAPSSSSRSPRQRWLMS